MSRITDEMLEGMEDLHALGLTSDEDMKEMRLLTAREAEIPPIEVFDSEKIKKIRAALNCSQAVFARYVGVTTGVVSKWERGTSAPTGPACRFLHVLQREGLQALL